MAADVAAAGATLEIVLESAALIVCPIAAGVTIGAAVRYATRRRLSGAVAAVACLTVPTIAAATAIVGTVRHATAATAPDNRRRVAYRTAAPIVTPAAMGQTISAADSRTISSVAPAAATSAAMPYFSCGRARTG